jgi:hypothetical protein
MLLVIPKPLINVTPWLKIFSINVREALFLLVVIKSSSVVNLKLVQKFVPIKDPIDSSILNLFFLVLLTTF